jgi:hypothetical protein
MAEAGNLFGEATTLSSSVRRPVKWIPFRLTELKFPAAKLITKVSPETASINQGELPQPRFSEQSAQDFGLLGLMLNQENHGRMVGTGRFELPTPRTPSECSTRLSHVPTDRKPAAYFNRSGWG